VWARSHGLCPHHLLPGKPPHLLLRGAELASEGPLPTLFRVEDYSIYLIEHFLADAPVVSSYGMEGDGTPNRSRED